MTTTTTAAIYARISRDKSLGTESEGLNVHEQIEACQNWIAAKGWNVGEIYQDNSISATTGATRPGFEKMLIDAPAVVVYWKQSRLEREPDDLDRFLLAGCEGHALDGTQANVKTASSELITKMFSLFGKFEQRNKSEFQKQASLRIAKTGKYRGSIRPFGQERDGTWVQPEADAVQDAVKHLLSEDAEVEKWSFYKVSEVWNIAGLKTPQTGKQGGKQWTPGTVRNYFTRPRLYGMQDYQGKLYELKGWTPLLTKDEFSGIQALIEKKKIGKRVSGITRHDVRLLTNIVRCAEPGCGRGMNAGQRGGAGSPRTYRCPTTKHVTITAENLEDAISTHALDLLSQHKEIRTQQEGTARRLAEAQGEKHRISIAHDEWLSEAIELSLKPSLIADKEAKHAEKVSALDAELFNLNQDKTLSIFEGYELTGWNAAPMDLRRDLLASVFSEIKISRGGQGKRFSPEVIEYSYTPLGWRLYEEWAGINTMNPWELKEGSVSSREPISSRVGRIKAGTTTLEDWAVNSGSVSESAPGDWNPVEGSRTKKQNKEYWEKLHNKK